MARDVTPLPPRQPQFPLLAGRTASVRVLGPCEAHALAVLWESMLQRLSAERAQRMDSYAGTSLGVPWRSTQDPTLVERTLPPLHRLPARLWRSLEAQTAVALDFDVHAALWAPYVDRATGSLPEGGGLTGRVLQAVPAHLHAPGKRMCEFLAVVTAGTQTHREYPLPGLRLRVAAATTVVRDPEKLVHCQDGPAMVWADGSAASFWRGQQVPSAWIPAATEEWGRRNNCRGLISNGVPHNPPTPQQALQELNTELRRAACEILGWDNVISALKPAVVNTDLDPEIGQLLLVTLPSANQWEPPTQQQFLRVRCGTGRSFALAVPPDMKTARQANAWTYGLDEESYCPEVRT